MKKIQNQLLETTITQVPPTASDGNPRPFSLAQLANIYGIVAPLMSPDELKKFNSLSAEEQEAYLSGFGVNLMEWQNAKNAANNPQDDDQNGMQGEKPNDGLDHWVPVKRSKNQNDGQSPDENDNKVYGDMEAEIEESEQERKDAEQNAAQKNEQFNNDPQQVADNASSIAESANKMAQAAQAAADAAQRAADRADQNANNSGMASNAQSADEAQSAADAAQDLADQAKAAAQKVERLADEAQAAADAGNLDEAIQKTKEAYDAAKQAANKTKAAQLNAKNAMAKSKQTEEGALGNSGDSQDAEGQQSGSSDQDINGMSGEQAAQDAQESANRAQNSAKQAQAAADAAQDKADKSGSSSDQTSADAAQNLADQAKAAADAAQDAADEAAEAADQGNDKAAQQMAKDAKNNANKAQQANQSAQQKAGNQSQQSYDDSRTDPMLDEIDDTFDQEGEIEHDRPISTDLPFDGGDFLADDEEMRQKCKEIAERAGQPLDNDDYMSPTEYASKKLEQVRHALKNYKQPTGRPGYGNAPSDIEGIIDNIFASKIDWRTQVQSFLTDKRPENKVPAWAKRRMGLDATHPFYKGRYLHPYEKFEEKKSGLVQVFFLVDASGSMGFRCGDGKDVFEHIMSELIQMELTVKIKKSAYTTFNAGPINRDDITIWTLQDAHDEQGLLEKLQIPHSNGGTSAVTAIKSIQEFDDLYSTQAPWTLLVVVTDGEDYYNGLLDICEDPEQVEHMIWIITNSSEQYFEKAKKDLVEQGVSEEHIVYVDTQREWGLDDSDITHRRK